jgi:thiamine pyrophosphate-dependent acetolactate synthase large subunit-like protein
MTKPLRGADIVTQSLARLGCKRVFTLSGNHIMSIFDAALDTSLDLVHVRHEAAAVHMADAWGRLTGDAGIALVTGGPGHANAVGALFTSLGAESPMVLLSGHAATWELGRGGFQEIRQADMAAPVAKASWMATSAANLGHDLGEAVRIATSGRPGPVHLSLARRRLVNGVAGAIGGSLSFALSARLLEPKAPIFAVLGDGTIGFHLSEFETAVRRRLPFIAVLGNDARWNAESQIQLKEYGRERMHGCELLPARYDQVVQALGGHGEFVDKAADLPSAIERALASERPACINIMVESIAAPVVRWPG